MLEGIPFVVSGPVSLLIVILLSPFYFMARGLLVPRSFLDDERKDTERWRRAHEVSEAARQQLIDQLKEQLAQGDATVKLLESINEQAKP